MHDSIKGEVSESSRGGGKKIAGMIRAQNRESPPLDSRKGPEGPSDQVRGAHSQ